MNSRGRTIALVGTMALTLLVAPAVALAGATTAATCQALKNKAAGKYGACRANAELKLVRTAGACSTATTTACYRDDDCPAGQTCVKNTTKYDAAILKCEDQYGIGWTKAELKGAGSCPTTSDQSDIEALAANAMNRIAWELRSAPRYSDNGDGTVTDHETGLMWEKKTALNADMNPGELHDADNAYRWAGTCAVSSTLCQPTAEAAAACSAGAQGATTACGECAGGADVCLVSGISDDTIWSWLVQVNTDHFAGHDDWRVATLEELHTLVDYTATSCCPMVNEAFNGASCGVSCTDLSDPSCSCTSNDRTWSATAAPADPGMAWFLEFAWGWDGRDYYETTTGPVRAVRGSR